MSRTVVKRIAYAGIVILWIVTTSVLIRRHYRPVPEGSQVLSPVSIPQGFYGVQWMGIYFKGRKIGYSRKEFDKTEKGYRMSERTKMNLTVMGAPKEIAAETDAQLSSDLSLESFQALLKADTDISVRGEIKKKELRLTLETAGSRSTRVIPLRERPSLSLSLVPALFREGIEKGRTFEITIFDPSTLGQERTPVEVTGRERLEALGLVYDAYKLKYSMKGTDFFIWLSDKGEVLKEESPAGFTLMREDREDAMKKVAASADLVAQTSLPFNLALPPATRYLKIRISGLDPRVFELAGGRQQYREGVLEITREDLPEKRAGDRTQQTPYLGESLFVQSKDRRILSLARDIVRGEPDRIKAAERILDWVYKNIEKAPSVTFPSAVDVLLTKRGDCNEHTVLFTALARAAGIPTKMAAGLVYQDGRLYYHAWPEIFAGRWIAVDPTLGQFPADAAHIRLVTGDIDQQTRMTSVIGKIRVEGIEYR
jgi:transglutaminase-like putative cysteine protease